MSPAHVVSSAVQSKSTAWEPETGLEFETAPY